MDPDYLFPYNAMKRKNSSKANPGSTTVWELIPSQLGALVLKAAGLIFPALSILLMVPFFPPAAAITATLLIISAGIFWVAYKRRSKVVAVFSCCFALFAVGWALVAPLLIVPRPLYIYSDSGRKPWETEIVSLSKKFHGNVLIISDPIRRAVFPFLVEKLEKDDIRVLSIEKHEGKSYLRFPFSTAVAYPSRAVAGTQDNLVLLPMVIASVSLREDPGPAVGPVVGKRRLEVGLEPNIYNLIEFRETNSLSASRWSVIDAEDVAPSLLSYAAQLDNAIYEMSQGRAQNGASMLEGLIEENRVPNATEQLRVSVLLVSLYRGMLSGSLGGLQSLMQNHRAYALLSPKLEKSDSLGPVERWAALEIAAKYREYDPIFADRISRIDKIMPKWSLDRKGAVGTREINARRQPENAKKAMQTFFDLTEPHTGFTNPGSLEFQVQYFGNLKGAALQEKINSISDPKEIAAAICLTLQGLTYGLEHRDLEDKIAILLKQVERLPPRFSFSVKEQVLLTRELKQFEKEAVINPDQALKKFLSGERYNVVTAAAPRLAATLSQISEQPERTIQLLRKEGLVSAPKDVAWWNGSYLDWFGYQTMKYTFSTEKLEVNDIDQRIASRLGPYETLVADSANRPFVPGMALIAFLTVGNTSKIGKDVASTLDDLLQAEHNAVVRSAYPFAESGGGRGVMTLSPLF